jgi:hypothetical protein
MVISEGMAAYGVRRPSLAEWAVLARKPKGICGALLGCGGEATGYARNVTSTQLVEACETHRHRGRW